MEIIAELVTRGAVVLWILVVSLLTPAGLPVVRRNTPPAGLPRRHQLGAVGAGSPQGWPARSAPMRCACRWWWFRWRRNPLIIAGYEYRQNTMDHRPRSRTALARDRAHDRAYARDGKPATQRAGRRVWYSVADVEALAGNLQSDLRVAPYTRQDNRRSISHDSEHFGRPRADRAAARGYLQQAR